MAKSQFQLITNGFFFHRHPDLPAILEDIKCNLEVSIHHSGQGYTEKFKPVQELLDNWTGRLRDPVYRVERTMVVDSRHFRVKF